jgi:hypothetical protein
VDLSAAANELIVLGVGIGAWSRVFLETVEPIQKHKVQHSRKIRLNARDVNHVGLIHFDVAGPECIPACRQYYFFRTMLLALRFAAKTCSVSLRR